MVGTRPIVSPAPRQAFTWARRGARVRSTETGLLMGVPGLVLSSPGAANLQSAWQALQVQSAPSKYLSKTWVQDMGANACCC